MGTVVRRLDTLPEVTDDEMTTSWRPVESAAKTLVSARVVTKWFGASRRERTAESLGERLEALATTNSVWRAGTVTVKTALVEARPSETESETSTVPARPAAGVTVSERVEPEPESTMLESARSAGFPEVAVTRSEAGAVSTSPTVNAAGAERKPAAARKGTGGVSVGESLRGVTVRLNAALLLVMPSLATTVMVQEPLRLVAGVMWSVRLESVPMRTRLEERRVGKECRSRWSPYH